MTAANFAVHEYDFDELNRDLQEGKTSSKGKPVGEENRRTWESWRRGVDASILITLHLAYVRAGL